MESLVRLGQMMCMSHQVLKVLRDILTNVTCAQFHSYFGKWRDKVTGRFLRVRDA